MVEFCLEVLLGKGLCINTLRLLGPLLFYLVAYGVLTLLFLIVYYSRIIRAFLVEEQKIVKKVLKIQKTKEKQASKS